MKLKTFIHIFFSLYLLTIVIYPQIKEGIDPNFVPRVTKDISEFSSNFVDIKLQPDGKLLAYGNFLEKMVRFNTDGSRDTSFNCTGCAVIEPRSVVVQPDGKIIVGGRSSGTNELLIRLNSDGSRDTGFANSLTTSGVYDIGVYDVQADGKKSYVGVARSNVSIQTILTVYRLNPNGSIDNTFIPIATSFLFPVTSDTMKVKVLSDGRVFFFGNSPSNYGKLAQLNPDGSKNTAFESPVLGSSSQRIDSLVLQPNGGIVIAGAFTAVNGVPRKDIARLNANSSVDITFDPQFSQIFSGKGFVFLLSGGKILFSDKAIGTYRLNSDGTIDNTYASPTILTQVSDVDSQDRAYGLTLQNNNTYKIVRLNADGTTDTSYNAIVEDKGSVRSLAVQTNGKIIVAGQYVRVNGFVRNSIARLNADGSTDTSFNPATFSIGIIQEVMVQTDGKVVAAGNGLVRLNSDGSLDNSFNVSILNQTSQGTIYTLAIQTDGKILIGGLFTSVNGTTRTSLTRLNADGSLDISYNPVLGDPTVNEILLQNDGKIVIGGYFTGVNGFNRTNLARLNSDGSLDTAFNATNNPASIILRQPDGKYIIYANSRILRLNADGSTDSSLAVNVESGRGVYSMYLQPDGSIVFGGNFTSVEATNKKRIARIFPNGSIDHTFLPSGADDVVRALAAQPDGKLNVGGDFGTIGGVTRFSLARVDTTFIRRALFDYDGDGRADVSVFRPSNGSWYIQQSKNGFTGVAFGQNGDLITPADFDGDGRTDIAVFRPSNGAWYRFNSSNGSFYGIQFGQAGDIPIPGDFDGDGKADISVFRPSNGAWYRFNSSDGSFFGTIFGQNGDKPLLADFDGDGKNDIAVFRPSNGTFYWLNSSTGEFKGLPFGFGTDIPVPADYDGDNKTDIAVFRPSNGYWYRYNSTNGAFVADAFGQNGDIPVAADYDGDGKANLAVFRPSAQSWYIAKPTGTPAQNFDAVTFGFGTDKPTPAAFQ